MRTIAEIRKDLAAKIAECKTFDDVKSEASVKAFGELDVLQNELAAANKIEEAEQKAAERKLDRLERVEGRKFSLVKFFNELASQRGLTGLEAQVAEMGAEEYRRLGLSSQGAVIPSAYLRSAAGQNYGTNGDGGNLIETMASKYVESLKEKLVVSKMGATVLTDLVGNVPVISSSNFIAGWGAEAAVASVSKIAFAKNTLTPHRNYVVGAITKDLLRQTSLDVEALILGKLMDAHAEAIDKAAIAGTGSNDQPTGILNNASVAVIAGGTNGAAISWANVVKLETSVNGYNANRGKMAYLTNAKVMGALKTTEKASNTARFIYEGDNLNGYAVDWTNLVPSNLTKGTASGTCSAMIFGNFEDLYIGEWGGLDIVVDNFSLATSAEVRFVLNAWNDVLVAEPKSFAVIKDITTA